MGAVTDAEAALRTEFEFPHNPPIIAPVGLA
jgi:hypothetical protein